MSAGSPAGQGSAERSGRDPAGTPPSGRESRCLGLVMRMGLGDGEVLSMSVGSGSCVDVRMDTRGLYHSKREFGDAMAHGEDARMLVPARGCAWDRIKRWLENGVAHWFPHGMIAGMLHGMAATHPGCLTGMEPCAHLSVSEGATTGLGVGLCVSTRVGG